VITAEESAGHPMRNYVECCLGGDAELPRMSITASKPLETGDVLLVCSDGFWSPLPEDQLASLGAAEGSLNKQLKVLGGLATRAAAPHSDNTSAAAMSYSAAASV
jgi:serine/threonine protein phosphatase PrpC